MVVYEEDIKNCVAVLEKGGTILYPTDTIWGIGCDALNEKAVDKVYTVKQRPAEKSMIVLLADARDVIKYVASPNPDIIAMLEEMDRPTTVIYNGALGFPDNVVSGDGSIGIRVTNDEFCKALIKRYRKPIVSTSANLSGMPSADSFNKIDKHIIDSVDYVVQYRQDDNTAKQSSRIVKMLDDGSLEVLRP